MKKKKKKNTYVNIYLERVKEVSNKTCCSYNELTDPKKSYDDTHQLFK